MPITKQDTYLVLRKINTYKCKKTSSSKIYIKNSYNNVKDTCGTDATTTVYGYDNTHCNKSDKCGQIEKYNFSKTAAYIPEKENLNADG